MGLAVFLKKPTSANACAGWKAGSMAMVNIVASPAFSFGRACLASADTASLGFHPDPYMMG